MRRRLLSKYNGYKFVDLGLPSGTLWATTNIGVSETNSYGLYFQWADTKGYTGEQNGVDKTFYWTDYKYSNGGGTAADMTKYNETDGLTTLQPSDDAAAHNMRGLWHVASKANFNEILNTDNCTNTWVNDYNGTGMNGMLFTSVSNSNTLFLPAAGICGTGGEWVYKDTYGFYWTNEIGNNVTLGTYFAFNSAYYAIGADGHRYDGLNIWPVIG